MNIFTKSSSLLPAFLLLFLAGVTSSMAFAQKTNEKVVVEESVISTSNSSKTEKTIEVEDIDGVKIVTVTTVSDGNKNVEIYKGEEAEKFLEAQHQTMIVEMNEMDLEDMEFTFNVEGMEEGDGKKIIFVSSNSNTKLMDGEEAVWISEAGNHIDMEDMNMNVTGGENGEPTQISMSYTDENGETVDKIIVIDETEIAESIEEVAALLEEMNINIDVDFDGELENGKKVKTVIVTKKILIEEGGTDKENIDSPLFEDLVISPNPSNGEVKIAFTPKNKGKVTISVLDLKGNLLFTDRYNGKGAYQKNITLPTGSGVVMVKIEQGNKVEVRKLILE